MPGADLPARRSGDSAGIQSEKSPERCSGLFSLPVAQIAMPIVRAAVGVGTGAVIGGRPVITVIAGTVVAIARPVIIGTIGAGDASRDRTGGKTERQSRANPASLSRRTDRGGTDGRYRRQNCECLFHTHLLHMIWEDNAEILRWFPRKPPSGTGNRGKKIADLREIGGNETKASEVFSIKCSNLARGES